MLSQEMLTDIWSRKKYHKQDPIEQVFAWLDRREEERRIVEAAENAAKAYIEKNYAAEIDRRSVEKVKTEFFNSWR